MAHSLYFVGIVAMHHADSLTPSEVAVLQALVQLHNVPNGVHPSVTWLCRESRLSRRAVNYALASLTERGALKVTPRYNDKGSQTSNDYRFNWPAFLNERGMAFIREEMSSLPEGHEFGNSWTPEEEDLEEENPKQGALVDVPTPPAAPRRNRRQPETPIPDDWKPTEAHRRLADERGVSLQYEAEQFRLHALAHDRRLVRWDAGFSQWLRKAQPRAATGRPVAPNPYRHFKDFTNYDRHSEDD